MMMRQTRDTWHAWGSAKFYRMLAGNYERKAGIFALVDNIF